MGPGALRIVAFDPSVKSLCERRRVIGFGKSDPEGQNGRA